LSLKKPRSKGGGKTGEGNEHLFGVGSKHKKDKGITPKNPKTLSKRTNAGRGNANELETFSHKKVKKEKQRERKICLLRVRKYLNGIGVTVPMPEGGVISNL